MWYEKFVLKFWKEYLDSSNLPLIDAKTQLQEHSLKMFKELPKYTFYKTTGPHHRPIFKTNVQIPNSKKNQDWGQRCVEAYISLSDIGGFSTRRGHLTALYDFYNGHILEEFN